MKTTKIITLPNTEVKVYTENGRQIIEYIPNKNSEFIEGKWYEDTRGSLGVYNDGFMNICCNGVDRRDEKKRLRENKYDMWRRADVKAVLRAMSQCKRNI